MNEREREQLNLIVVHGLVTRKRALAEAISAVLAEHSAKGRLHSGATVIVSVRVMHEFVDELLSDLSARAKSVATDKGAFELVAKVVGGFLDYCAEEQMPPVLRMASGRLQGARNDSVERAGYARFDDVRADIEAKLAILAFDFSGVAAPPAVSTIAPPAMSSAKTGGRPLAGHWDDMWADIALQLWNGTLAPKTQADIERAMANWISTHDLEAGDTVIRGRARRLWDKMQSA